ncbi:MAG: DMT family transporter [SAR324 cluster bacterium]|nr:DMT family transporter [SAR324 cluster bacterium]
MTDSIPGPTPTEPRKISAPTAPSHPVAREVDARLVLWMLGLTLLWGLNAISLRVVTLGIAPITAAAIRGAIALAFLTGYALLRRESLRYSGWALVHGTIVAVIFALEFVAIYSGASLTNGSHVAIFVNTAPFFVTLGAHYWLPGERMHLLRFVGLVVAFLGIVLLFSDEFFLQQTGFWRGDLLVMVGAALWASTTLYIKRFMVRSFSGFRLLYIQVLISTPILGAIAYLAEPTPFFRVNAAVVSALLFQAIVVVFFSYLMWIVLLRIYPAGGIQSLTFMTPVWGVLAGVVLLGESVSVLAASGIALVGFGLYIVNRPSLAVKAMPKGNS